MPKVIENPKEKILMSAKKIAAEKGIAALDIRSVAKECEISIGSVYNYYPTKVDLLIEVIEDFWRKVFLEIDYKHIESLPFLDAIEKIYCEVNLNLSRFKENWLVQISSLDSQDKVRGREKEQEYFSKIKMMILKLMEKDKSISLDDFGKEKLAAFIFDNMLIMLRRGEADFSYFKKLLEKLLI